MSRRIEYADVYDYDRLWRAWHELHPFERWPDVETWLFDLHNELVWHRFKPRLDADRDAVVACAIERRCGELGISPNDITDETLGALARALF